MPTILLILFPRDLQPAERQHKGQHLVAVYGAGDPGVVVANLGVDTGPVRLGTAIAPGNNTLQLTIAHDWATRISLERVEKGS